MFSTICPTTEGLAVCLHSWLCIFLHIIPFSNKRKKGWSLCSWRGCSLCRFTVMWQALFRGVVGVFWCWLERFKMFCYLRQIQIEILSLHTVRASPSSNIILFTTQRPIRWILVQPCDTLSPSEPLTVGLGLSIYSVTVKPHSISLSRHGYCPCWSRQM